MNIKLSRRLLVAEAVVFALPLTGLLSLGVTRISISSGQQNWSALASDLVTVLAAIAAFSGWWLIVKAVRGGAEALRRTNRNWWLAASLGVLLVAAAVVSMLLPPSPEYSPAAQFRDHLELCTLGVPLVVILGHLWAEARFRKTANKPFHATCEDARA